MNQFWNLEKFISLFPVHLYMIDVDGHYQACNELQAKDFGLKKASDILGKTNYELPSLKNHLSVIEVIESNNKKVFSDKKAAEFYEPGYDKKGQLIHFKSYKIPLFQGKKLMGLIGISFDLSQEAERIGNLVQKMDRTELTFNNIINNLPEHIYWLDTKNRFLGCNANQAKDFGLTNSSEVVGLHVSTFQTEENAKTIITNNNKILKRGIALTAEESFLDKKGENRFYLSKKVPLKNSANEIMGIVGISVDITERKQMEVDLRLAKEKAEAANFLITEFISNMGHDLSTPITDVSSIAQMLSYHADEYPELKELLDLLIARSEACEKVRSTILSATSISNLELKLETFPIAQVLLELEKELRPGIGTKSVQMIIKPLKPKKDDLITTDREKFKAVLYDLISNAINFTREGQVSISVTKEGATFKIKVSDTGIGIPADKFDYIFQQYTKLSRSNQHGAVFKGVGAGLYLARIRATILNAAIEVESVLGKGSTFTFIIPVNELP